QRHEDFQSSALPTELSGLFVYCCLTATKQSYHMRREISTIFSHFSVLFCGVFSRDRFFPYLLALILVVLSLQFMYNES
ncbi:MAG: hypothetical protein ACLRV8_08725, partial [Blautia hansenii]